MAGLMEDRLKKSISKHAKIILKNELKFDGTITGVDSKYLEIVRDDHKGYKIILLEEIAEVNIDGEENG